MSKRQLYYDWGYEDGKRAERERIKEAIDGSASTGKSSTLWMMVGGSIGLTIFGWCFVGLILLLGWIGGNSGEWWFPWIWKIAFWVGVGFIVIMSIAGVIMAIAEDHEAKNPPKRLTAVPKSLRIQTNDQEIWKKKYPIGDVETVKEAQIMSNESK